MKSKLADIKANFKKLFDAEKRLSRMSNEITELSVQRRALIAELETDNKLFEQSDIKDMIFGIEAKVEEKSIVYQDNMRAFLSNEAKARSYRKLADEQREILGVSDKEMKELF